MVALSHYSRCIEAEENERGNLRQEGKRPHNREEKRGLRGYHAHTETCLLEKLSFSRHEGVFAWLHKATDGRQTVSFVAFRQIYWSVVKAVGLPNWLVERGREKAT